MELGQRIRKIRRELDLTQAEFAERLGSVQNTITGYETGRKNPSKPVIALICREFGVNEDWLLREEGEMFTAATSTALDSLVQEHNLSANARILVEKFIKLKADEQEAIFSYIQNVAVALQTENTQDVSSFSIPTRLISYYYKNASAGTGQLVIDNLPDKDIEIPDLPEYRSVSYAIGVNGNSMEPFYSDGNILLVEATEEIDVGEIGIFQIGDECFVKKLGDSELISLNPHYENIPLNESARVMGRVIGKL